MKTLTLAAAFAVALLSTTQAADGPAVLRGVSKKQTLTTQQMQQVRGQGGCCSLLNVLACANLKVDAKVNVNTGGCGNLIDVNAKVKAPVDINAIANVAGLLGVHANVKVPVNVNAHVGL